MYEDYLYKKFYQKWYKEYIENIDLSQITWIKLTQKEISKFYLENYYDEEARNYVLSTNNTNTFASPFGLTLTSYSQDNKPKQFSHLLGIVPNQKGTYTIVAKLKMNEHYQYLEDVPECILIEYIEINSFFQNRGIYKQTIKTLINFIDMNKNIVLTNETPKGRLCHTQENFNKIMKANGYQGIIKSENEVYEDIQKSIKKRLLKKQ